MMSWSPSLSVSKFTVTSIAYKWPICSACSNGDGERSPIFPADTEEASVQWQIKIHFDEKTSKIGLCLYGSSKHISSVRASFALVIQLRDGQSVTAGESEIKTHYFDPAKGTGWTEIGETKTFVYHLSSHLRQFSSKPFTIHCTIDIFDAQRDTADVSLFYNIPVCTLWQDFESLLSTGKNSDVTLVAKANSQKLKAHKAILMARSPVFDAMFSNQLRESIDNAVIIDDLDFDVLDAMVRFIYTGKALNLSNVADRLLMAADKYDLPILRVMCEQALGINLSVENASQTLVLADLHHANQLKKHTLSFIKHHAKSVLATDGWQVIKASHPNLLDDVCQSLSSLQLES